MIIFILVFLFRITYNNSYETSLAMIIIIGLIDVITTFFHERYGDMQLRGTTLTTRPQQHSFRQLVEINAQKTRNNASTLLQ